MRSLIPAWRWCWQLLLVVFLCWVPATLIAGNTNILVLHSYHKGLTWTDNISKGIEDAFPGDGDVELFFEYMDTKRAYDQQHLKNVHNLLQQKYRGVTFQAIISSDDHAFQFLMEHGDSLFPATPIVFCGVNRFEDRYLITKQNVTGIVESFSIPQTLDAIMTVQPSVRIIYAVVDDTTTGRTNNELLDAIIPAYSGRLVFQKLTVLTMEELERRLADLPPDAAVLWLSFTTDAAGKHYSFSRSFDRISQASSRPVYSMWDFGFGHGMMGGMITSGYAHGQKAAEFAKRIIQGEQPDAISVLKQSPNHYIFDYEVMRRHGVKLDLLPAGSQVINLPVSFYQQHKLLVWQVSFAFLLMAVIALFTTINLLRRRSAEKALKASEKKYRQLVENANDAIFIAQDGKIAFTNKRTLEIVGYPMEQVLSMPFPLFIHPDDREMVVSNYQRRLAGESDLPATYSFRVVSSTGEERVVQLNVVFAEWQGKPATLNFVRDITEQLRLEQSLLQAQKLESLGTFAGGIAHDFNNLLMAIQGRASLLKVQLAHSGNQMLHHVKAIEEHVASGVGLTRQLLGSARGGKYNPQPIDLNVLMGKCAEMFGRTRKDVQFVSQLASLPMVAVVDEQQIEQVLLNILVNAGHAMPQGGEVTLGSSLRKLAQDEDSPHSLEHGSYVVLEITDSGIGMDGQTMARIFDPFFTTKDKSRGTGLGLASAYGIIKNHDGAIEVRSEPGKGATFLIYLPASDRLPVEYKETEVRLVKGEATVLLVDDEEMIREISGAMLTELGYKVEMAASGREAVDFINNSGAEVDLVILDLLMPGLDGAATFGLLREVAPHLPIIISSGYARDQQTERLIARGRSAFMQKPFDLATLSTVVEEMLQ